MARCALLPPAAPCALRLRFTFIEPEDGERDSRERGRPRASSAPASARRSLGEAAIFDHERAYVAALADKLQPIWDNSGRPLGGPTSGACANLRSNTVLSGTGSGVKILGAAAAKKAAVASWQPLAFAKASTPAAPGTFAGSPAEAVASPTATTADGGESSDASGGTELRACEATRGGTGHPELCARPCVFYVSRGCSAGSDCKYCHMPHEKRPAQLDKRRRQMLSDMTKTELKAVILPFVREKTLAFDPSVETSRAFDRLAAACGFEGYMLNDVNAVRKMLGGRALALGMRAKNIQALLVLLQHAALQDEPEASCEADAFLRYLRALCAPTTELNGL